MDTFNFFMIFPDETSVVDAITDEDSYKQYLNETKDFIDRADCEKGVTLFYDDSEKKTFINTLKLLAVSGEFYLFEPGLVVSELLRNSMDWTDVTQKHDENNLYALWDFNSRNIDSQIPPSVKEASEYELVHEESKQLLLNLGANLHKKILFVLKDCSTYAYQECPIFIKLEQVHNFEDLEKWLMLNRTSRQLNRIDQRHNERSLDYIRGKSPILYDLSRDNAAVLHLQKLLDEAISDQHESKDLINYDPAKERYIWFEYENENPQNQFHAYHLAKPITHEQDLIATAKIPERAKRFIDKKSLKKAKKQN